ncbi:MAG: short-chain dehydrogenase, partial [Pseudomonadota bacterium]|nr:short-chain dehydrogenase [Pseudomonadota bacterium]
MSLCDLSNKRLLLTQAADFMGPALQRTLQACGAEVVADNRDFLDPKAPQKLIAEVGSFDVLLLNL